MSRESVFNSLSHAGKSSQLRVRLRHDDIKISPFCVYSDDDDDDDGEKVKSEEKRWWF